MTRYKERTAEDILNEVLQEEEAAQFQPDKKVPWVALNHLCERKHAAIVTGLCENKIRYDLKEAAWLLQDRLCQRLQKKYPETVQEVILPTTWPGSNCRPDILIPELRHCIQVKTATDEQGYSLLQESHRDQVLLEWFFWRQAGYCITQDQRRIDIIPETYEVFYLGREHYGQFYASHLIEYNRIRANVLHERFRRVGEYLSLGELPPPPRKPFYLHCRDCTAPCPKRR